MLVLPAVFSALTRSCLCTAPRTRARSDPLHFLTPVRHPPPLSRTHHSPQLVLADSFDPYKLVYERCLVFNPGSFQRRRFTWSTYHPHMSEVKERMEERRVTLLDNRTGQERALTCCSARSELPGPDD